MASQNPLHTLNTPALATASAPTGTPANNLHALDYWDRPPVPNLVHASVLRVPCAAELRLLRRQAGLERPNGFRFTALPGRIDGGIDTRWGSRPHRFKVRVVSWVAARSGRDPQPVYLRGPVKGACRGIWIGLLVELAAVGAIAAFIIARKIY